MAGSESEMTSPGEVESPMQSADQQQPKNNNHNQVSQLGRQSSIYSLTLDEFQHTLNENGKNFGSMNMDEFLTSIWNAEENQQGDNLPATLASSNGNGNGIGNLSNHAAFHPGESSNGLAKKSSLPRQGSFSLPAPLCRKTVDEVWSEIQRGQNSQSQVNTNGSVGNNAQNSGSGAARQPTFGEMTLEDFLVRAGIVRENTAPEQPVTPPPQQYDMYPTNNHNAGQSFASRPLIGMNGGGGTTIPAYQAMPQGSRAAVGESSAYGANGHRNGGYGPPAAGGCYVERLAIGCGIGSAYGVPGLGIGVAAPVSPASSDGMCGGPVDPFRMGVGISGGRKRIVDGPVEKVVERRQRRMIKNRESAARSRARKQAYTVELEAELNQLREENAQLREALERRMNRQHAGEVRIRPQTKAERTRDKLRMMRRCSSCEL